MKPLVVVVLRLVLSVLPLAIAFCVLKINWLLLHEIRQRLWERLSLIVLIIIFIRYFSFRFNCFVQVRGVPRFEALFYIVLLLSSSSYVHRINDCKDEFSELIFNLVLLNEQFSDLRTVEFFTLRPYQQVLFVIRYSMRSTKIFMANPEGICYEGLLSHTTCNMLSWTFHWPFHGHATVAYGSAITILCMKQGIVMGELLKVNFR